MVKLYSSLPTRFRLPPIMKTIACSTSQERGQALICKAANTRCPWVEESLPMSSCSDPFKRQT